MKEERLFTHENAAGEAVDFHATRHTYISGIVAGGNEIR